MLDKDKYEQHLRKPVFPQIRVVLLRLLPKSKIQKAARHVESDLENSGIFFPHKGVLSAHLPQNNIYTPAFLWGTLFSKINPEGSGHHSLLWKSTLILPQCHFWIKSMQLCNLISASKLFWSSVLISQRLN